MLFYFRIPWQWQEKFPLALGIPCGLDPWASLWCRLCSQTTHSAWENSEEEDVLIKRNPFGESGYLSLP